jgi:NAD-dependent dihydropyrimidine dehydrogenase PreA subunit
MKRTIISIDETKCTGCGQCIPDCPEGALQIIDGKAHLVSDLFCDGLGACIGTCPEGAISVIEREAAPYDEKAVMGTIVRQGVQVIRAHLEHLAVHGQVALYNQAIEYMIENGIRIPDHRPPVRPPQEESVPSQGKRPGGHPSSQKAGPGLSAGGPCRSGNSGQFAGCPGSAARIVHRTGPRKPVGGTADSGLRQWPVQLRLVNPAAPYFENADLLITADCVPFAFAGFHAELLRGRIVIVFCPKLDSDIEEYISKLAEIFSLHTIRSIMVARMEVPCCGGVRYIVDKALGRAGTKIPVTEKTITIEGGME